jgi:multiple antibiotic resistance protein
MHELILFSGTVFMGMFAIMNPIANATIFISLTQTNTPAERLKIAFHAVLYAFIIVGVFCVSGHFIFTLFGITLPAFQITGGILLFFVGYSLLQGKQSAVHHFPKEADAMIKEKHENNEMNIAISPLAIPILAGPGTIATAMNFVGASSGITHLLIILISFAALCLLTFVLFVYGQKFVNFLGRGVIGVITRIMGLILAVIATQMVITGIHGAIQLYPAAS